VIRDVKSRRQNPAITSDRWHVVHAVWSGNEGEARFDRKILSEHADFETARAEACKIMAALSLEMGDRPRERRDQIFVRKPNFKSLKVAGRRSNRPK
jgi:hypothetical protein